MGKVTGLLTVLMVIGAVTVARQSVAADLLLEIDVDQNADIVEVRIGGSGAVEPLDFKNIPIDGFDWVSTERLDAVQIRDKGGSVAWCCWISGDWEVCRELMTYKLTTPVVGAEEKVSLESPSKIEGGQPIAATHMESLKSHAVMVFKDDDENLYGMVVSADGMWYGPEEFRPY